MHSRIKDKNICRNKKVNNTKQGKSYDIQDTITNTKNEKEDII